MLKNSLAQAPKKGTGEIEYKSGDATIKLSPSIVKRYLVSGDASNITDQEIMMFLSLCKYQHLNPWTREAYCIKYGNQPATLVVGKAAFQKRAEMNPNYDGMDSGIIVMNDETGDIDYRRGTLCLHHELVVGGWAEVYRKDRTHPTRCEVSFNEYAGRKKDGSLNSMWSSKPATMIRKVAMVHALRDAFPTALEGMYAAEEQGYEEQEKTIAPQIPQESVPQIPEAEPAQEIPKPQEEPEKVPVPADPIADAGAEMFR